MWRMVVLAIVLVQCAGCASVSVERVEPGSDAPGLRFFQPAPYLLVAPADDGGGELTCRVIWLPNYAEQYVVRPTGVFGSGKITAKLVDGWQLAELGIERATIASDIPQELLAHIPAPRSLVQREGSRPDIAIYRFKFGNDGALEGLEEVPLGP